jgi:hypothetical protein
MAIADVDGDGLIDYNEFVAATMHVSKLEKEELLQKVRAWNLQLWLIDSACSVEGARIRQDPAGAMGILLTSLGYGFVFVVVLVAGPGNLLLP